MADLYQGGTPQLRRSSPRQTERSIPGLSMDRAVVKHRQFLDKVYGHISDPFKQWSLKRDSLKRMVEKAKPDYDKADLDVIYNQFGLSDASTPGDFTREQGVWSSASRAMDIAGKSFGQLYDTAGMLYDRETGDKEGMMENQRQIQQAQHESAVIRQFEIGPEEDRNIIKQFVFDLTASAPVMAGIMGVGFVGGLALAKVGVVAWLAGMLGMGAADALTEVGFNYADIVGDPGVREKIEKALGEKMTEATEEEIGLAVQKHLMDQADDSAVKVGLANFFNPLNAPQFTALRGLIKPGSASLGAIRRAAFQSGTREGVEEFLQSSGSQFYAEEAKTKAMIDAGVEDAAEPEGLQAKLGEYVDWGQSFYEGMMGVTVGAFIGGGQGYRGHVKYMAGKAEADASGNLKYKKPGDENFIPAGQLRFQTRQIVDMPDEGQGLESLDLFLQERAKADSREEEIVRDEISKMKAGSPLLGERSTPEKRANRKAFLGNYKEGTHLTPEQASGSTDPAAPTVAELNVSPELRAEYKLISDLKEEDRSEYEIRFLKVAEQFPDLDYKQLQTVVDNSIKHGWTQDGGATGWRKAAEAERKSKEPKEPAKRGEQVAKPKTEEDLSWMEEKPDETLAERDVRQSRIEAQERIWAEEERESGLQANETPEETEQRHVREAAETEVRRERARLSQEDVQRIMRQRGEAVGDTGTTLDEHGKVIDTTPTKAPERTAVSLTENELDRGGSSTEITNLLNEWGAEVEHKGKEGQNNKNLKLMKQFVLRTENKGKVRSVVVEKTGDAREKQLKKKEQDKKYSLTHTEFYFTPEQRLAIATEIAAALGLSVKPTVKAEEVTAVVDEEVVGETVEVVADEAEVVEEEAARKINRKSPNKKHYNRNNEAVEQTVDDSGIDDLIGTVVAIETGKGRSRRDNVPIIKEGGLDAAPSGENIPAGRINTGEYVPSTKGTAISFIRFEGIKENGDINFVDLKYDKFQERTGQTIAKLIQSKRPVSKGQSENALRHLQTGVEKTWVKFKPDSKEGSASFATVSREAYDDYVSDTYTEESTVDMAESDQAIAVRAAQQELTNLKNELNNTVKQNMVGAHFDIVVNAIDESLGLKKYNKKQLKKIENLLVGKYKPTKTEKDLFNRINDTREKLNSLLSSVKAPKISVKKGGERVKKPRRSKLGDEQRDINIRIGNLTEALKDGKLSNEDKVRIIDDMERTARELGVKEKREINLKLDDVVLETGATQTPPVAGMRQWLVVHVAKESRNINTKDLLRIIRLSGYKPPALQFYVERPEGQFGMEIAEPIKIEDKKYFVTEEEQKQLDEAWKRWKAEQDNLQHALTVRMRGPLKGTNVMGGSKAEPPTTVEAEGKPSATVIPFPKPKTKTGITSEVIDHDSGDKYVGEVKKVKGETIRHGEGTYTWADGDKYVGGWKNNKKHGQGTMTHANGAKFEGGYKDDGRHGQGTMIFADGAMFKGTYKNNDSWEGTQYFKDGSIKNIISKGKAYAAKTETEEPPPPSEEEVVTKEETPPEEAADGTVEVSGWEEQMTISTKELEDALAAGKNEEFSKVNLKRLKGDPRYSTDLSQWDGTEYSSTEDFTRKIKSDLGIDPEEKTTKFSDGYKETRALSGLIREKLMNHIEYQFIRANSIAGQGRLRNEIEAKWWPILSSDQKKKINARLKSIASSGKPGSAASKIKQITHTILKKKSKVKAEPVNVDFLSENMESATRKVPTKKPKVPDVWQIIPTEARKIFGPLATTENSKAELNEFLDKVKNIFIVVRKNKKWFALEVLPNQPLTGAELAVPLAIRKKLTREGKTLGTEKPKDQISRKLTDKELTDREGGASERLVQLYKTENISTELMEAMADKRIGYTDITKAEGDEGKVVEVWWLDSDGNWEVDGQSNQGYITFKDSESATKFDESIKNIDPLKAAQIDKQAQWERHELLFTSDLQEHIREESLRGVNVRDVEDYSMDVTEDMDISDVAIESDLEKMISERTDPKHAEDIAQDQNEDEVTVYNRIQSYTDVSLGGIEDTFAWSREEDTKTILDNLKNRKTTSESREVDGKPREFLSMEEVEQQVEEFRSEYPASFPVEIVETHTDLPSTQDESETSGMIEDGKVWIVRDRMYDKETVLKNLWHEEIGHLGIENFLGEAKFGELVNDLQEILPEDVKQDYLERIPADFGSLEARKTQSMKEYLAYNAEERFRNVPATIWDKILSWFRDALRGAGVKIDFNELDLKMLVLRSADKLRGTTAATMIQGTGIKQRRAERSTIINTEGLDAGTVKFFDKLYPEEEGRFAGWNWAALKTKLVSKIFDPFLVINQKIGKVPYMQTRLANRSDGVLAAKLRYSGVKPVKTVIDGVTVNELKADKTVKALFTILKPLGKKSEINRFAGWIVALRANMLKGEERERFFSNDEIQEGVKANQGRIKDARTGATTSRELVYKQVAADLARWNKSVVDLGIGFGLFDSKSASAWNTEWYMPFFRLYENQIGEDKQRGVANYKNLTDQKGVHKLLGSEKGLKNPMNNLVKNALHIIDASIKNDAAVLTLQEAAKVRDPDTGMMLAEELKQGEETPRSVRVIKNGFDKYYNINNQLLFEALASLHSDTKFAGFGWAVKAKGLFTQIVTASPVFKYWNVLRDTMSAAGTTDVGYNLFKNSVGGFMSLKEMQGDMLISGAYIQFAYNRSDDPNYAMSLLTKEMSTGFIAANPENHKGFRKAWELSRKLTSGVWGRYQAIGDKLENANRAAIYKGLMEKNKSMTESAFEARDLLDFTLHGSADWVRLVTALTPFANAMLQGKYKLGRAIINNPKPVVVVSSAMVLASLMEYYIYEEDEEWHRRPDWDKDTFFWIKLPGTDTRFRMPKPHEFSLIGNLAWRGIDMAKKKDPVHGPLLASAIRSVLFREFNVSPIPQVVKPLIEVGINKNLFFDRPIEPLGVKNLSPSEKRGMYTSETMIMLSKGMENILWDEVVLSPFQLEHIVNGYFGWLGQTVLAGTDSVVRKTFDFPEKPAAELMDHPIARKLFQASPIRNTRAGGIFYERLKEIEQASADLNLAKKLGDWEHYREIYEEKKDLLKWKSFVRKKQRILNNINKRIRKVMFDKTMSAESKRVRMDRFYSIRNRILDILAKSPAMR